jgi:glycosyltransferase involved in cell wall biosynthesis
MKIGILSQPSNFHCQKWARALQNAGAEVVVFSLEKCKEKYEFETISFSKSNSYKYIDFHLQANHLKKSLISEKIDVLHPLHVTPYGTWARLTNFRPLVPAAMGADIFEYPPFQQWKKMVNRAWANTEGKNNIWEKTKAFLRYQWFKNQVNKTLQASDFITADNLPLKQAIHDWFQIPDEKIKLIRWGVETEMLANAKEMLPEVCQNLKIPIDKPLIFSPRGAMSIYQADIIIDAFEKCLEANLYPYHTYLMLSSGYAIAPQVRAKALKMKEQYQNFIWVDRQIPREWVSALWHICDIFISIPIYDGFSAAVSEGMWMGAIPLVNNIPGNSELIENERNGWMINEITVEKIVSLLAEKENQIGKDKEKYKSWNQNWIEEHAILSKNAKQFLDLLH